ncbi:hypothetical protein [Alcaligenes endophyticus]|uniref:Uncharacterized protein n=1 Tax=Alcaligenes endophyticus TaxID=1929088 RepID=A0ABT8EKH4_9BURK|nr:hypothetical protein [Alcaligenes endophyticus]MCX5592030.1 hypothetical protein [Alcaligenes endophyticus]MDN4121720.1 hypothetical protein [Alcaligenes endophyticus]
MTQVKFLKNCGAYTIGDVAGFEAAKAELLIERNIAEKHTPERGKAAASKPGGNASVN